MASKPPKEAPPTLYSAIPGQGMFSIGDANGKRRWINAGGEVNGWKVGPYDTKTNTLSIAKGNRTEYLQMGSGSVGEYTPPLATPDAQMVVGSGGISDAERKMMENEMIFKNASGMSLDEYNHNQFSTHAIDLDAMNKMMSSFKRITPKVPTATPDYQ